jgi:hypothetical protein
MLAFMGINVRVSFIPLMVRLWRFALGIPNVVNKQLGAGIDF